MKQPQMLKWPLGILAASWALSCVGLALEYHNRFVDIVGTGMLLGVGGLPLVAAKLAGDRRGRWWPPLERSLEEHADRVDALSPRFDWLWIALAAGLGLFLELVVVRFHASCFQLFAFFKNFSLLSCFLGLGIGYALGATRPLLTPVVLPMLAAQMIFLHVLRFTGLGDLLHNPISEQLALGLKQSDAWFHAAAVYGFLLFIFCFNAFCFIPLGQLASRTMARPPRLVAYGWNLLGSLGGIALFFGASALWTPPVVWAALGVAGLLPFIRGYRLVSGICAAALLGVLGTSFRVDQYDVYSPYQILSVRVGSDSHPEIRVNHDYFQKIWDLSDLAGEDASTGSTAGPAANVASPSSAGRVGQAARYYMLPYALKPRPQEVLIVGAGTGNDVAAAARNGAGHVDAVEIDPAIISFGRLMHPEKPYDRSNVTTFVNDARAHLRHTGRQYDLIVFGLLDSHTLLSGIGSVRLDSYIYTVDAFREARARLKPGGVIVLTFAIIRDELGKKLHLMLRDAFDGRPPAAFSVGYDAGVAFVIGDDMPADLSARAAALGLKDVSDFFFNENLMADVSTDDWPFFYMPVRKYPVSYAVMIVALLAVAFVFVTKLTPPAARGFSPPCFLLGAGFMLLETKAITELALFYGSTWVVVGVVIAAVLVLAFVANLLLIRITSIPVIVAYALLLASLGFSLAMSYSRVAPGDAGAWTTRLVHTGIVTLPLFFAGVAFSTELRRSESVGVALSSNLLGAMLGGCLEYNAMYFGYRSLYWLSIVVYAAALLMTLLSRRGPPQASGQTQHAREMPVPAGAST